MPYEEDQTQPFPDMFLLSGQENLHQIEAVSLPSAARALGREDEAWLIQVCVHQRVLQTHFAIYSDIEALDLFHLQNSIKATPEIDAVFLLTFLLDGEAKKALVTLEAKRQEPILPDQVKSQIAYMAKQTRVRPGLENIEFIVPVAATSFERDGIRVVALFEMEMISVGEGEAAYEANAAHRLPLSISKSVGYSFAPTVSGI